MGSTSTCRPCRCSCTSAPAQGRDDDSARPLSLPLLNLLASLRARQDEENSEDTVRPSLPPQHQVTKRIMQQWTLHEQMLRNPPTSPQRDVHMLHRTQSVPLLDEHSALRGNMPQRNDEEGGKTTRSSFSPASSVWGQMGRSWSASRPQRVAHHGDHHGEGLCCLLPSVLRFHQ